MSVARGVGYPACRQAPYVALVVPAYGEICDMMLRSHVALSGVETDPIRGVGCTGVWGDM
ncbi:organic cation/carnitine transporter 3 [Prunus dulcis]|uniref:Organic cation/carnitine transporter 3 n=1 Tax=Prunus dulcis TaxID=3755 RepID=A0A4Y1QYS3_PRUDU|nr:organic cation/carnitine transporter 3 [Prunus dulcis]